MRSVYTTKIISSYRDLIALVFYGTEQSKNPRNSFKHVYVYHDLDEPGQIKTVLPTLLFFSVCSPLTRLCLFTTGATRVRDLDALLGDKGEKLAAETMGSGETSLGDALWCCANLYSDIKYRLSHKRLMIFTCRDDPHGGNSTKDRQAHTKARDLKETGNPRLRTQSFSGYIMCFDELSLTYCFFLGVMIDLMHLMKPGGFDVSIYFRDIVSPAEDESELGLQLKPCDKLDDLRKRVLAKEQKKRSLAR